MERINGESISGIALAFMAILFIYAGQVDSIWALTLPASYVLLAVGIALIGLGRWTTMNNNKNKSLGHQH